MRKCLKHFDCFREPQKLTPVPLPEEKKSSLYSQILASYK